MLQPQRGQALVETALLLPVLLLLALGLLDLGRIFYYQVAISGAAAEGARVGARAAGANTSAASNAATSEAAPVSVSVTVATPAGPPKKVRVTVTHQFTLVTPFVSGLVGGGSIQLRAVSEVPHGLDHSDGN